MKKLNIIIIVIVVLLMNSCSDYLDINTDPRFPQDASGEVLLPVMLAEMVRGETYDSRYFGSYVQNWARTSAQYVTDLHGYFPGSDALGEKWRQHYWAIGVNVDLMIEDGNTNNKMWYAGVAKAIRAWSWQSSTDVYGEMILKEAWEPNRYIFDYDPQEEIYAEVVRLCNEALADLDKTDDSNTLARGDLVYQGNRDRWKKFVYAVLARNAHHISNKAMYDPDKVITYVDLSLTENADNFSVPHAGTSSADANFFGPTRDNLTLFRQTVFSISLVNGTVFNGVSDPRMSLMFASSPDGQYRGIINGAGNIYSGDQNVPSLFGKYLYQDKAVHPLVTAAELQFIKAEAAFIKGDAETALSAYQKGIRLHMDFVGVVSAAKESYMISDAVKQTAADLTISDIMLQKYIALYGHGILETWVDLRRYHYDADVYTGFALPNPFYADNGGKPAYRARPRYNSEYVWNVKALDAIGAINADYHTYEPWFIKP